MQVAEIMNFATTFVKNLYDEFMKHTVMTLIASLLAMSTTAIAQQTTMPGSDGNKYIPYEERTGNESIVYFTRSLTAEGLIKAYEQVSENIEGNIGIKLHTGEQNGPNIIPREWVKALLQKDLPEAKIVETNTYYKGDRYTTEQHRKTLEVNGWTFCPVDIMDEEDTLTLPVHGGKWFRKMSVGSHMTDYNSLVVLTHFKGHTQGGFGGSNKNIGIGCADGRIGKAWIHTTPGCEGVNAAPVVTPNVGILSSTDILALDQACVDLVYAMTEAEHHDLVERIETRHGLRQLSYMKELGMGNNRYILIDLDNGGKRITAAEAVKGLKPFVQDK